MVLQFKRVAVIGCFALLLAAMGCTMESPLPTPQPASAAEAQKAPAMVRVRVFNKESQLTGPVDSPKVILSQEEWKKRLKPEQFEVLRSSGTERPFCGHLLDNKLKGIYSCAGCGLPLFSSDAKFQSGTGWPSFFQPVAEENVAQRADHSHGVTRKEINCARCDGHLGHVFDDGPKPTGLRFCLNSASLAFTPSDKLATLADPAAK